MMAKVKSIVQLLANSLGYEIRRRTANETLPPTNEVKSVGEYTYYFPYGYCTYSPWQESWFQELIRPIRGHSLITEDRCYVIYILSRNCAHLPGDFAECGTYKGGSAYLIATAIEDCENERFLHLFDTFSGIPDTAIQGVDGHKAGDFADVSFDDVKNYLAPFPFVVFHRGLIPDTLATVSEKRFSFLHIDVDIYQTARDRCEFFYPRMVRGGIMLFDDYGFPQCRGLRTAVDQFFAGQREIPLTLPTGQCLVIKL